MWVIESCHIQASEQTSKAQEHTPQKFLLQHMPPLCLLKVAHVDVFIGDSPKLQPV